MNEVAREVKPESGMILIERLPFEKDRGIASRARLGLLVLGLRVEQPSHHTQQSGIRLRDSWLE